MLDFSRFELITFDCYGTLIDWESGLLAALTPILSHHRRDISPAELLALYGELEMEQESGAFQTYRTVLQNVVRDLGRRLQFQPEEAEIRSLPEAVKSWVPYSDTVEALKRLKTKYRLAIISNIDDDLFAASAERLRIPFDAVTTAQQAQCYKPGMAIFELARKHSGVPSTRTLHAGQSIYHDVLPAQSLGLATVWVNRPSLRENLGAVQPAQGTPDLEVHSLEELAEAAGV